MQNRVSWAKPSSSSCRSHGYEFAKDGFGFAGIRLSLAAGEKVTVKIKRLNIAERLYRVTGEGIYRDSVLLGEASPLAEPLGSGMVAGQDSAFAELYQQRIVWFWGDTSRMSYPLGHFWMAGAVSDLPGNGGLDPGLGINLRYYTNQDGFSRPVARLGVEKGLIWADAFLTLPDPSGRERLVCHYAHMESLGKMLGHGLAVFNDDKAEFERLKTLDLMDRHLFPGQAHPIRFREADVEHIYFGQVFPNVRVKADWNALSRSSQVRSLYLSGRPIQRRIAPPARCRRPGAIRVATRGRTGRRRGRTAADRVGSSAGRASAIPARGCRFGQSSADAPRHSPLERLPESLDHDCRTSQAAHRS